MWYIQLGQCQLDRLENLPMALVGYTLGFVGGWGLALESMSVCLFFLGTGP